MSNLNPEGQADPDKQKKLLLEQIDKHIRDLAWRRVRDFKVRIEELDLEADELAQQSRIALWNKLDKDENYVVHNLKAYVNTIMCHKAIDMQRKRHAKPSFSLSLCSEDITPLYADKRMQDPLEHIEQDEAFTIRIARIAEAILELPPRQKLAVLCSLKDAYDDTLPLLLALEKRGIEIKSIVWPDDRAEVLSLKASLTVARKKLRRVCCL